jgi:hypothetical protein
VQIDGPDDGIEVFSRAAIADGMRAWTMAHVTDDACLRLYAPGKLRPRHHARPRATSASPSISR